VCACLHTYVQIHVISNKLCRSCDALLHTVCYQRAVCAAHSQVCADTPYIADTLLIAKSGGEAPGVHTTAYMSRARCTTKFSMRFAEPGSHSAVSKGAAALVARANFFRKISEDLTRRLRDVMIQSPSSALRVQLSQKLDPKAFEAIFEPLWRRITLCDRGSAGEMNTPKGKMRQTLTTVLSLLSTDNTPFVMSALWKDVTESIFSPQGGVGVESEIKRLHLLQVASDGNGESMCGDILIKSSQMGQRPKPRQMKAVWMKGNAPPSKAGVPTGPQQHETVLLEKEDAQKDDMPTLRKAAQAAAESGQVTVNGDGTSIAMVQGQEGGQDRGLGTCKKTKPETKAAAKLLVLSEIQGLEVEYAVLQVIFVCAHTHPRATTHQPPSLPDHTPACARARVRACVNKG